MLQAVKTVEAQLSQFRSEEKFHQIFTSVNDTITQLDLKPISLPRQKNHQDVCVDQQLHMKHQQPRFTTELNIWHLLALPLDSCKPVSIQTVLISQLTWSWNRSYFQVTFRLITLLSITILNWTQLD